MTFYPGLVRTTHLLSIRYKLLSMAEYLGDYMTRWEDQSKKIPPFEFYDENANNNFPITSERRINQLVPKITSPPLEPGESVPDQYKFIGTFFETDRNNRAVFHATVWYDTNLNNTVDTGEPKVPFSIVLSEKRN